LEKRNQSLYEQVISLNPGDSVIGTAQSQKILLAATAFQADAKKYHLVAFQNINEAIDETEAKAWQKLLSVLTHEIMNSIAPISSLADTIKNRIASIDKSTFPPDYLEDLEVGTSTIKRRSEGLIKFAETYRNLNKISNLNLEKFYVRDLFENLYNLMQPTFSKKNIELGINLRVPNLMLEADVNLLEQVLINLLLNAFEAVKEKDDPQISLLADTDKDKIRIQVIDNGNGIPANMLDKIFVPFFSTKKNGSGIGLTLCQQIMMLHKGHIQVQSKVGEGTVFSLQF
jgi:signal transduction histidine kinase